MFYLILNQIIQRLNAFVGIKLISFEDRVTFLMALHLTLNYDNL